LRGKVCKTWRLDDLKKTKHRDKVAICWKFSAGNCTFGDAGCWFLHCESEESPEWKFNLCDNKFRCQTELLRHNKQEHEHLVQMCWNIENGKFIFGSQDCWFKNEKNERAFENDNSIQDQKEVIEKVFEC
jgi:hypothetical protein